MGHALFKSTCYAILLLILFTDVLVVHKASRYLTMSSRRANITYDFYNLNVAETL